MYFKYLETNALKWTALKELNSLATKSKIVFFKVPLLTYQIFPVSVEIKRSCRSVP